MRVTAVPGSDATTAQGERVTASKRPTNMSMSAAVAQPSAGAHYVNGQPVWIVDARKVTPKDARVLSKLFFARLRSLEEDSLEYHYARDALIEMNTALVRLAASRLRGRGGGDLEDIIQAGTVGLIKAINRFDLAREVEFSGFALPYVLGEIKRYSRDATSAVPVPRRLHGLPVKGHVGDRGHALADLITAAIPPWIASKTLSPPRRCRWSRTRASAASSSSASARK